MKTIKPKEFDYEAELKRFVVSAFRRVSLWWPARNQALKNARVARGIYKCNICGNTYPKKEVVVDHVSPVVKLTGFKDYDEYVRRMFPPVEGFQIICKIDHHLKTLKEKELRKEYRALKKANKTT